MAVCTAAEPSATHETESNDLQDRDEPEDDTSGPTLDEDPNDEVDDGNVLSEVKLAATIRKLLSSIPSLKF